MDIPKQARILDIQKSYFGYQKQQFWISENKHLFQISKIVIMDIRNKCLFSDIRNCCFFDIQNNFFGYLKYLPVLGYPK